jgi:hypothetical protein
MAGVAGRSAASVARYNRLLALGAALRYPPFFRNDFAAADWPSFGSICFMRQDHVLGVLIASAMLVSLASDAAARETSTSGGIRQLESKHLTLLTDLPSDPEIDKLPAVFDLAFPQWCAYFGVDEASRADWHVRACLMQSRERFQTAGHVPGDVPEFASGYSRGSDIWLLEQPSAYYRRHLLLHEGTHVFMDLAAGGKGPPWFAEGMAELLATHQFTGDSIQLNYFPAHADELDKWGRIEMVQAAYARKDALTLERVLAFDVRSSLENQSYGWCWAACAFFDHDPRYRQRFRQLPAAARDKDFAQQLRNAFAADWAQVNDRWRLFVANIDYGYDFAAMEIESVPVQPLPAKGSKVEVAADRGWQSSGVRLEAGRKYRLRSTGRYQVASEPRIWWCEPGGVTIRYYHGQPLGILLAAVCTDQPQSPGLAGLLKPIPVGLDRFLSVEHTGTLYLRVNDSAGGLKDNAGTLTVDIVPQ